MEPEAQTRLAGPHDQQSHRPSRLPWLPAGPRPPGIAARIGERWRRARRTAGRFYIVGLTMVISGVVMGSAWLDRHAIEAAQGLRRLADLVEAQQSAGQAGEIVVLRIPREETAAALPLAEHISHRSSASQLSLLRDSIQANGLAWSRLPIGLYVWPEARRNLLAGHAGHGRIELQNALTTTSFSAKILGTPARPGEPSADHLQVLDPVEAIELPEVASDPIRRRVALPKDVTAAWLVAGPNARAVVRSGDVVLLRRD